VNPLLPWTWRQCRAARRPNAPPGAGPLILDAPAAYRRAEGLSVHEPPERPEAVDALPRGETLRELPDYWLRQCYSETVK